MLARVISDLEEEEASLLQILRDLTPAQWDAPTPAQGWAVRDQVFHLAIAEDLATLALTDTDGFAARLVEMLGDLDGVASSHTQQARNHEPAELLAWWRSSAAATVLGLGHIGDGERVAWVTGPMSATSFATARLMETWAHGHDITEAVGIARAPTARLRHIADLGVRTRGFSFRNRGEEVPAAEPRVELLGPDGEDWSWGPPEAEERVEGEALDFCLVVTQRRRVADSALRVTGNGATRWMAIAQCFAGPPT